MAISTSTLSPGVYTSLDEKWTWNPLTPGSVPAGARISAGKSGKRGQVVAVERDGIGELAAGDLHAVAGVAAETDAGFINYFALSARNFRYGRWHIFSESPVMDEANSRGI